MRNHLKVVKLEATNVLQVHFPIWAAHCPASKCMGPACVSNGKALASCLTTAVWDVALTGQNCLQDWAQGTLVVQLAPVEGCRRPIGHAACSSSTQRLLTAKQWKPRTHGRQVDSLRAIAGGT